MIAAARLEPPKVISGSEAPARTPPAGAFHFTFFAPREPVALRFTRRRRLRRRKGQRPPPTVASPGQMTTCHRAPLECRAHPTPLQWPAMTHNRPLVSSLMVERDITPQAWPAPRSQGKACSIMLNQRPLRGPDACAFERAEDCPNPAHESRLVMSNILQI